MTPFTALDGTESCFLKDSIYTAAGEHLLQDINARHIVHVQQTTVYDKAGTTKLNALLVMVKDPAKQSPTLYYFNTITVAAYISYLATNNVTNSLKAYNGNVSVNFRTVPSSNILLNEDLITNRAYNVEANTTDVYVTVKPGSLTIYTFIGNLTIAAAAVTAVLAIPLITTPVSGDTLTLTFKGVVAPAFTVAGGSPSQATVHTALQAYITAHTPVGYSYTDVLASQVDTYTFTSPLPGVDHAGEQVSFTRTGTTFGAATVTATFA